ncbi:hypothetical protein PtB15_3B487 [Puccinia triticina]|nr:hypothetical protein PtB15_3B487 [Puccinia triticina]
MSSNSSLSRKPSQRLVSAVRSIKRKVRNIKGRPADDNFLGIEPFLSENILDINFNGNSRGNHAQGCWPKRAAMLFEFEVLPGFYRTAPNSSSHPDTKDQEYNAPCATTSKSIAFVDDNFRDNPREHDEECIHVRQIPPPLPRCPLSTSSPAQLGSNNKLEQPLPRLFCPPPRCEEPDPSFAPGAFSAFRSSGNLSASQEKCIEFDLASRMSIRLSVSVIESSFDHASRSSRYSESSEPEYYAKCLSSRLDALRFDEPLDFIHRRSNDDKGKSKQRRSSFGVARIIISTPNTIQMSQLSPSFKTWLGEFIESHLSEDASLERLADSFDPVIMEDAEDESTQKPDSPSVYDTSHLEDCEEVDPETIQETEAKPPTHEKPFEVL